MLWHLDNTHIHIQIVSNHCKNWLELGPELYHNQTARSTIPLSIRSKYSQKPIEQMSQKGVNANRRHTRFIAFRSYDVIHPCHFAGDTTFQNPHSNIYTTRHRGRSLAQAKVLSPRPGKICSVIQSLNRVYRASPALRNIPMDY